MRGRVGRGRAPPLCQAAFAIAATRSQVVAFMLGRPSMR